MTFAQMIAAMAAEGWFLWSLSNMSKKWSARWASYHVRDAGSDGGRGLSPQGVGPTAEAAMMAAAEGVLNPIVELDDETREMLGL